MMNLTISGNVSATEALSSFAIEKLSKIDSNLSHIQLKLEKDKHIQKASFTLFLGDRTIKASESTHDMYVSIDLAVHKLRRQLIKQTDKRQLFDRRASDKALQTELDFDFHEFAAYEQISDDELTETKKNLHVFKNI